MNEILIRTEISILYPHIFAVQLTDDKRIEIFVGTILQHQYLILVLRAQSCLTPLILASLILETRILTPYRWQTSYAYTQRVARPCASLHASAISQYSSFGRKGSTRFQFSFIALFSPCRRNITLSVSAGSESCESYYVYLCLLCTNRRAKSLQIHATINKNISCEGYSIMGTIFIWGIKKQLVFSRN